MAKTSVSTVSMAQLVSEVAESQGVKKAEAKRFVEAVLGAVKDHTIAGHKVSLAGFGIFQVKQTAARMGRNPQTGEQIKIKAKAKLAFRAAKAWKDEVPQPRR